jgi:hypothetical protein
VNRSLFFGRQGAASPRRPARTRLQVERLETRELLSANIDVSNQNDAQWETSIDVNPVNPQNLVAASINSNHSVVRAYYSQDGGNSWKTSDLPLHVQGQQFPFAADPSVAFDSRGNVYVAYNAIDNGFFLDKGHGAIAVARSSDGGATFPQVTAVEFDPNTDHPKITIDKDPGSPYRDTVYVTWKHFFAPGSSFDVLRSRSVDGGLTWSAPVDVSDDPGQTWFNATAVGPEGNVYVTWIGAINPSGGATQFVDRSTDGGLTFGHDGAVAALNTNDVGQGVSFSSPAQPNLFSNLSIIAAQAGIDTDRSAGPFRGRVYLVYADRPDPVARPFDMDVYLRFSDNHGQTWSARQRVNDDGPGNSQFFPNLSVDPADGTVVVSWYDTRHDPSNLQKTDVFLAVGTPTSHGVGFRPNLRVTDEQSDESANNTHAQGNYGDYEGLVAFGGVAHPVWCDARVSNFPPQGSLREEVYTAAVRYGAAEAMAVAGPSPGSLPAGGAGSSPEAPAHPAEASPAAPGGSRAGGNDGSLLARTVPGRPASPAATVVPGQDVASAGPFVAGMGAAEGDFAHFKRRRQVPVSTED